GALWDPRRGPAPTGHRFFPWECLLYLGLALCEGPREMAYLRSLAEGQAGTPNILGSVLLSVSPWAPTLSYPPLVPWSPPLRGGGTPAPPPTGGGTGPPPRQGGGLVPPPYGGRVQPSATPVPPLQGGYWSPPPTGGGTRRDSSTPLQ